MFKNLVKGLIAAVTGPKLVDRDATIKRFKDDGRITTIRFSPDSTLLASGSTAGKVRVRWLKESTFKSLSLPGPVRSLDFSPDGASLVIGCETGVTKVWSLAEGEFTAGTVSVGKDQKPIPVRAVACHPNGSILVSASPTSVDLSAMPQCTPTGRLPSKSLIPVALAFSTTGDRLAVGAAGEVSVWETGQWTRFWAAERRSYIFGAVGFSPDGSRLAAGTNGGLLLLLDRSGKTLASQRLPVFRVENTWWQSACNSLAFTPDGRFLVTGHSDFKVRVWNATSLKLVQELESNKDSVLSVGISPDGKYLAAGDLRGHLVIWSLLQEEQ